MRYKNYVILSDFDGTLTNNDGRLRESEREHIDKFTALGGTFAVATGRELKDAREKLAGVNINSPCILSNGAIIAEIKHGTIMREKLLPPDSKKLIKAIIDKFPDTIVQASHSKGSVTIHYSDIFDELFAEIFHKDDQDEDKVNHKNLFIRSIQDSLADLEEIKEPLIKANVLASPSLMPEALTWLRTQPMASKYRIVSSGSFIIDINSCEVSKGEAANYLRESYYASKDMKIIALGDEENDLEALKNADIAFAPQWARKSVIECADHVLDTKRSLIAQVMEFLDRSL